MTRHRRRGVAPLEFAMVLPLLFAMVAVGWWCARCGLTRTAAATDARRAAWEKRAEADPGTPFDLKQEPLVSAVGARVVTPVPGRNPLPGGPVKAETASHMTDKTWADKTRADEPKGRDDELVFPELDPSPVSAHRDTLDRWKEFIPFINEHAHKVKGFAAIDLPRNGDFKQYPPQAMILRMLRVATSPAVYSAPGVLLGAAAYCAAIAYKYPPAAGYIPTLLRGAFAAGRLTQVVTK
jgi:hypothetical protein